MESRSKANTIRGILAALRAIDSDVDRIEEAAAARLGVNRVDFRCLDILSRGEAVTAGRLAAESGLTTGAVTALIDRLERLGYVTRKRDANDRRRVLVEPTKRAMNLVWPMFAGLVAKSTRVLSEFTAAELRTILRFLEADRAVIREHLDHLRER